MEHVRSRRGLALDELRTQTTITIEQAAQLIGVGRSAAYEAARRGELPTRRLGRRLLVPVPALLDWLGATPKGA
jgi:excisionase family DNA binding protein